MVGESVCGWGSGCTCAAREWLGGGDTPETPSKVIGRCKNAFYWTLFHPSTDNPRMAD